MSVCTSLVRSLKDSGLGYSAVKSGWFFNFFILLRISVISTCLLSLTFASVVFPGGTREIGSALTRMCMRHRSIEAKLRQFSRWGPCFSQISDAPDDFRLRKRWRGASLTLNSTGFPVTWNPHSLSLSQPVTLLTLYHSLSRCSLTEQVFFFFNLFIFGFSGLCRCMRSFSRCRSGGYSSVPRCGSLLAEHML